MSLIILQPEKTYMCQCLLMLLKSNRFQSDVSGHLSSLQDALSVHVGNKSSCCLSQHFKPESSVVIQEKNDLSQVLLQALYVTDFCAKSASTPGIKDILRLLPQMGKHSRAHISPIHPHHIRFSGMPFGMKYRNKSSFIYRVIFRGGRYQKW